MVVHHRAHQTGTAIFNNGSNDRLAGQAFEAYKQLTLGRCSLWLKLESPTRESREGNK